MSPGFGLFSVVTTPNHLVSKIANWLLPSRWVKTALLICFSPYTTLKSSNHLRKYKRFFLHYQTSSTRVVCLQRHNSWFSHSWLVEMWTRTKENISIQLNSPRICLRRQYDHPFVAYRHMAALTWYQNRGFSMRHYKYFIHNHGYLWSPRPSWSHISLRRKKNFQIRNKQRK